MEQRNNLPQTPFGDSCPVADATYEGRSLDWAHIERCPICLRRLRIEEARLREWTPLPTEEAERLIETMVNDFMQPVPRSETLNYEGFYAALARDPGWRTFLPDS